MSLDLKDFSASPYIVSNDYPVGHEFPLLTIERIESAQVPTPGKKQTTKKLIIFFKGALKGWCVNMTEARRIGQVVGTTKDIGSAWIGTQVQLVVVGDVRRPDGTRGNALRIKQMIPPSGAAKTTTTTTTTTTIQAATESEDQEIAQ